MRLLVMCALTLRSVVEKMATLPACDPTAMDCPRASKHATKWGAASGWIVHVDIVITALLANSTHPILTPSF